LHDPRLFITPSELQAGLRRHDLDPRETLGMAPKSSVLTLMRDMCLCKLKRITPAEAFRRSNVVPSADVSISYVGFARKSIGTGLVTN
jgi:hypothetical protein